MSIRSSVKSIIKWPKKILIRHLFYRYQHVAFKMTFEKHLMYWKPDIIHCNDWQTLSLGLSIKEKTNAKLIFDSHELEAHRNPPLPKSRKRWLEKYERKHFKLCDMITTVCDPISSYLSHQYKMAKPLVVQNAPRISNTPNHEYFKRWGRFPNDATLREECDFGSDDFVIIIVGNVTINRGIETAVDAMSMVSPRIKLAVLGKVTPEYKEMLTKSIIKDHHFDRIKFLDPVHPEAVVEFIKSADVGLIPLIPFTLSYELALPNKFFECAFAGLPIISSDTIEVKRMIEKYDLGQTYASGDSQDLARVLTDLFQQWQTTKSIKKDNSAFIKEFCFNKTIEKVIRNVKAL